MILPECSPRIEYQKPTSFSRLGIPFSLSIGAAIMELVRGG
jgi:hypothetical protein